MKNALFINIDSKPFTGFWDGKPKTFKPGQDLLMPEYLAKHYAKHLTNKLLLDQGKETMTSPKFPEQVPDFMEIFNRCCVVEEEEMNELDGQIQVQNANNEQPVRTVVDNKPPQIIKSPDDDENKEFPDAEKLNNEQPK